MPGWRACRAPLNAESQVPTEAQGGGRAEPALQTDDSADQLIASAHWS